MACYAVFIETLYIVAMNRCRKTQMKFFMKTSRKVQMVLGALVVGLGLLAMPGGAAHASTGSTLDQANDVLSTYGAG